MYKLWVGTSGTSWMGAGVAEDVVVAVIVVEDVEICLVLDLFIAFGF